MFKNMIAPIQAWLLSQHRCVGCGVALKEGKKDKINSKEDLITCKCKRVFIYDKEKKQYFRAPLK